MREGFAGTIETEGTGRRERFIELARVAVGILEAIAKRVETSKDHPQPLLDEGGDTKRVVDARLVPVLDLSPAELGSPKIATYFTDHEIEFSNQTLSFKLFDGKRAEMSVGPSLAAADFFFHNDDKDLSIVFARLEGGCMTVRLDDGVFAGLYDSDDSGKPVPLSLE